MSRKVPTSAGEPFKESIYRWLLWLLCGAGESSNMSAGRCCRPESRKENQRKRPVRSIEAAVNALACVYAKLGLALTRSMIILVANPAR